MRFSLFPPRHFVLLINRADPVWEHYQPFRWWLLPHGLAGACAILLGPLQFSDRLRQRFTKFHRVVGRFYIAGALIVAPLGAYIQFFEERSGAPRPSVSPHWWTQFCSC
jgi:Predicted membrane protein (DUF2306)